MSVIKKLYEYVKSVITKIVGVIAGGKEVIIPTSNSTVSSSTDVTSTTSATTTETK